MASEQKPKRRLLQYSLRTFLLLVTVFSVWLAIQVNKAQKQRAAVAAIREAGGTVMYEWMAVAQTSRYDSGQPLLDWEASDQWEPYRPRSKLGSLIGEEYFQEVNAVNFDGHQCLHALQFIPEIQQLILNNVVLTSADLRQLTELPNLHVLSLSNLEIPEQNIEVFKTMTELKGLFFVDTNVTEAAVDELRAALPGCDVSVFVNPVRKKPHEKAFGEPTFELLPTPPQAAPSDEKAT